MVLFVGLRTTDEDYKQTVSPYPEFQGYRMNNKKAQAGANQGIAIIGVNIDELNKKSGEYREFVILEEFCHLLDDQGDSKPKEKEFWDFVGEYSKSENDRFAMKVAHELNSHFNHYNVNKLLMVADFEKWLKYRNAQYGKQLKQRTKGFYNKITELYPQKQCIAIFLAEMVKVISFMRAVESYINENKATIGRKKKEKLEQIVVSTKNTIDFLKKYAEQLGLANLEILDLFTQETFT